MRYYDYFFKLLWEQGCNLIFLVNLFNIFSMSLVKKFLTARFVFATLKVEIHTVLLLFKFPGIRLTNYGKAKLDVSASVRSFKNISCRL